jgi:lysophospholipase L1-like esterase
MKIAYTLAGVLLVGIFGAGFFLLTDGQPGRDRPRMLPEDRDRAVTYTAMGDSSVFGVGASSPEKNYVSRLHTRLRSAYPRASVHNLGVSGATAADVVDAQLQQAIALRPDLITLSIGPNDITQGRDARQFERNIEDIFATMARETDAVLVVSLIPDMAVAPRFVGDTKAQVGNQTIAFNEVLGRKARQHGVEVVDLYAPSREEVPKHPELVAADEYHPSDQGYARWADLMWRGVEARIP